MLQPEILPLRTFPRRLRVGPQPLPAANDLRLDLRDCDDAVAFAVSLHLPQMPWMALPQLPRRVQVCAPARAPVSTVGATQPPEPPLELRAVRPAHYHRT
jgi:hypothetical protein